MTTKLVAGAFVVEREIRIRAPRERVFALLSSREHLASWMPAAIFEPRAGGNVEFRFVLDDGGKKVTFGKITACDPPSRIAFTWDFKDDPLDARTEVTFDLSTEGQTTLVRLTHTGFVDEAEAAKHAQGWGYWLERLQLCGEGQDLGDDPSVQALRDAGER